MIQDDFFFLEIFYKLNRSFLEVFFETISSKRRERGYRVFRSRGVRRYFDHPRSADVYSKGCRQHLRAPRISLSYVCVYIHVRRSLFVSLCFSRSLVPFPRIKGRNWFCLLTDPFKLINGIRVRRDPVRGLISSTKEPADNKQKRCILERFCFMSHQLL